MSSEDFLNRGEETYSDVPQGGGGRGFIGKVKSVQRWDAGWVKEDTEIGGVKFPKGRAYVTGTKEEAEAVAKELGGQYANQVVLFTLPVASVTNMDEENKAKFTSGIVQSAARIVGIKSEKYGAGLNYVTLPSMIDAYARACGWYEKPLFDAAALNNLDKEADAQFAINSLAEMRKAIWAALGESNPEATFKTTKSERLKKAFDAVYLHPWDGWVRLVNVSDPSPKAYYRGEVKDDEEADGQDGKIGRRNRVPVIVEFFAGEKAAVEAGKKELSERGGASSNGNGHSKDYSGLFAKISAKAKETYTEKDWLATATVLADEIATIGKGGKLNKPQMIKIAGEYAVEVADVELIQSA